MNYRTAKIEQTPMSYGSFSQPFRRLSIAVIGFVVIVVFVASAFLAPTTIGLLINPYTNGAGLLLIFGGFIAGFCILTISLPSAFAELVRNESERSTIKIALVAIGTVIESSIGIFLLKDLLEAIR